MLINSLYAPRPKHLTCLISLNVSRQCWNTTWKLLVLQSYRLQLSSAFFKVKWPTRRPHCTLKLSHSIAKSMADIINQSCGDFQQGGCLCKPTSGIQWTPEHSWTSDKPQKQASACQHLAVVYWQLVSLLIELFIDDENCSLTWCA